MAPILNYEQHAQRLIEPDLCTRPLLPQCLLLPSVTIFPPFFCFDHQDLEGEREKIAGFAVVAVTFAPNE